MINNIIYLLHWLDIMFIACPLVLGFIDGWRCHPKFRKGERL